VPGEHAQPSSAIHGQNRIRKWIRLSTRYRSI
jgi:hypothetical protein